MSKEAPEIQKMNRTKKILALALTGLLGAAIVGATLATNTEAFAHPKGFSESHGKWHRGGPGRFANLSDEQIQSKITRFVKHVAIEIDANEEQQTKIAALMVEIIKDVRPLRKLAMETRGEFKELMLSDTVDRAAIETLRTKRMEEIDRVSQKVTQSMIDVAEVLEPNQRKILSERIEQFQHKRRPRG